MLYLIGLGLYDEKDITLKGIEIAKKCECFLELYTSKWHGSLEGLEKLIGKKIKILERSGLEEKSQEILDLAKKKDVAVFVLGDPLAATTHINLILDARKQSIGYQIIHNASIFSAVGETGLQLYKFGRTATIPYAEQLSAVKDALEINKKASLHTLLLLDIKADENKYMSASEAAGILIKNKIIDENENIIAAATLGSAKPEIYYKKAKELLKIEMGIPAVLIVPGKLHFAEKEFLEGL